MSISGKLLLHNRAEKIRYELEVNNQDIDKNYLEEKFLKMSVSPYAFFRGSNHLFWEDFYNDWRIGFFGGRSETLTWINGDAHIYNYGAYSNHHGEAIFCLDDFDDSIVADYQFDLWRMAISVLLDCRENGVYDDIPQKKALSHFADSYLNEMIRHEEDDPTNEVHLTKETTSGILGKFLAKVEQKRSRWKMLDKWTKVEDGRRVFDFDIEKLERPDAEELQQIQEALKSYRKTLVSGFSEEEKHFEIKDIAKRVKAGTGSLGARRYYILLEGDSEALDDDVILDMKEQGHPPLVRHMNEKEKDEYVRAYPHEGERHSKAFQALAEHPDRYLGWTSLFGTTFSLKERSPYKSDFPTEKLKKKKHLYFMATMWGQTLASRHKRASYELNDDAHEMPIFFQRHVAPKRREFKALVSSVALRYADRVFEDYQLFLEIIR